MDVTSATLVLELGEIICGDLFSSADGTHVSSCPLQRYNSQKPQLTVPQVLDAIPHSARCENTSKWKELLPMASTEWALLEPQGYGGVQFSTWLHVRMDRSDRRIYYYPCADHKISNLVAFIPSTETDCVDKPGEMNLCACFFLELDV